MVPNQKKIYIDRCTPRFYFRATTLFIFSNDLLRVSHVFKMLMYADDTTLCCNLNGTNCEIFWNNELSKISDWLSSNKLSVIIKKYKHIVTGTLIVVTVTLWFCHFFKNFKSKWYYLGLNVFTLRRYY